MHRGWPPQHRPPGAPDPYRRIREPQAPRGLWARGSASADYHARARPIHSPARPPASGKRRVGPDTRLAVPPTFTVRTPSGRRATASDFGTLRRLLRLDVCRSVCAWVGGLGRPGESLLLEVWRQAVDRTLVPPPLTQSRQTAALRRRPARSRAISPGPPPLS